MFDGISASFIFNTLIGIVGGGLLIYFKDEVASIASGLFGTSLVHDIDKPYAYVVLGWLLIISNLGLLVYTLLT